ncbi:MAG: type II secretion system major pseudopilin GspG [Robiginitomaculum sp.]|nr:type II secretion system major pseudopilin GspG [Robiginitomaculum sp.]
MKTSITQTQLKKQSKTNRQAGYTIMELMVVMLIIVVIVGLVAPRFIGQVGTAKTNAASVQIKNLSAAVEFFYLDTGRYPTSSEGLSALVSAPGGVQNWNGPYLKLLPDDPWKNPYIYRSLNSSQFIIKSLGADNKEGGDGQNRDHSSEN